MMTREEEFRKRDELIAKIRNYMEELDLDVDLDPAYHNKYLQLILDILRQIRADGAPGYPVRRFLDMNGVLDVYRNSKR